MIHKVYIVCSIVSLMSLQSIMCMKKREREESTSYLHQVPSTRYGKKVAILEKNKKQVPTLHAAARLNASEIQSMLDQGARLDEVHNNETPLHRFITARNSAGIEKLLFHGASVLEKDAYGETALHRAARNNPHIATMVVTSPQGSPAHILPELATWWQSNITLYLIMKKHFGVPKDICKLIGKLMDPELKKLVTWMPFHKLAPYLGKYSLDEKKRVLDFLLKRHIADLLFNLDVKNNKNQTPRDVAVVCRNRMRLFVPPISILTKDLISQHTAKITANYAKLLGIAPSS